MTWTDEIIDEVRRVRDEHAEKFNYDIAPICADMRQQQAASKRRIVAVTEKEVKAEKPETPPAA